MQSWWSLSAIAVQSYQRRGTVLVDCNYTAPRPHFHRAVRAWRRRCSDVVKSRCDHDTIGQRHAKRDLRTYAKGVDQDQPPRLRRRVWSESALFDTCHINSTYISCCVINRITFSCFQYCIGTDLGLHYL